MDNAGDGFMVREMQHLYNKLMEISALALGEASQCLTFSLNLECDYDQSDLNFSTVDQVFLRKSVMEKLERQPFMTIDSHRGKWKGKL